MDDKTQLTRGLCTDHPRAPSPAPGREGCPPTPISQADGQMGGSLKRASQGGLWAQSQATTPSELLSSWHAGPAWCLADTEPAQFPGEEMGVSDSWVRRGPSRWKSALDPRERCGEDRRQALAPETVFLGHSGEQAKATWESKMRPGSAYKSPVSLARECFLEEEAANRI